MMSNVQSLIKKLWKGNINPEEARALDQILSDENSGFKNELQESFFQSLSDPKAVKTEKPADKILESLLLRIEEQENKKKTVFRMYRNILWWSAASVILIVGGVQLYNKKTNNQLFREGAAVVQIGESGGDVKVITNHKTTDMEVVLADRSTIILSPQSAVSYHTSFGVRERNISLKGKGFFKVSKNKALPFSVFAEGVSTTALGTEFTVSTLAKNTVEVKLFEGKVVVRKTDKSIQDIYLVPGQQVSMNTQNKNYNLSRFEEAERQDLLRSTETEKQGGVVSGDVALQFANEPLTRVFDQLSTTYKTRITYSKDQVDGLYFSGSVLKKDSLKTILSIITNMNGLKYEETNGEVLIKK
jgi:transmembrane sensor